MNIQVTTKKSQLRIENNNTSSLKRFLAVYWADGFPFIGTVITEHVFGNYDPTKNGHIIYENRKPRHGWYEIT